MIKIITISRSVNRYCFRSIYEKSKFEESNVYGLNSNK